MGYLYEARDTSFFGLDVYANLCGMLGTCPGLATGHPAICLFLTIHSIPENSYFIATLTIIAA